MKTIKTNYLYGRNKLFNLILPLFDLFADERLIMIPVDKFEFLFSNKYGDISQFNIYLEHPISWDGKADESKYVLVCETFGFKYVFPLLKK